VLYTVHCLFSRACVLDCVMLYLSQTDLAKRLKMSTLAERGGVHYIELATLLLCVMLLCLHVDAVDQRGQLVNISFVDSGNGAISSFHVHNRDVYAFLESNKVQVYRRGNSSEWDTQLNLTQSISPPIGADYMHSGVVCDGYEHVLFASAVNSGHVVVFPRDIESGVLSSGLNVLTLPQPRALVCSRDGQFVCVCAASFVCYKVRCV